MGRNKFSVLVYILIGLAVIGVISQLLTNTADFLSSLFLMVAIGAAIFAAIYFIFLRKKAPSNDMKKYKQAVKQSKAKYQQQSHTSIKSSTKKDAQLPKKKSSRRAGHLRVIEGSKSKRKNRASN